VLKVRSVRTNFGVNTPLRPSWRLPKNPQSFFGDLKLDEAGAIVDLLRKALSNEQ
jgi:hypothetical protein